MAALSNWFGAFDYPITSGTYEEIQDPEMAEMIAEELIETAEIFRRLKGDGWQITMDWGEDEATCQVSHPGIKSSEEANARLRKLRIFRFVCIDITELREELGL